MGRNSSTSPPRHGCTSLAHLPSSQPSFPCNSGILPTAHASKTAKAHYYKYLYYNYCSLFSWRVERSLLSCLAIFPLAVYTCFLGYSTSICVCFNCVLKSTSIIYPVLLMLIKFVFLLKFRHSRNWGHVTGFPQIRAF